jgi:sorbitol-specific phosphotransferase system component IIC
LVKVQNFNCVQLRESGYMVVHLFRQVAKSHAKSMTNNLPLLSVLAIVMTFDINKATEYRGVNQIKSKSSHSIISMNHMQDHKNKSKHKHLLL